MANSLFIPNNYLVIPPPRVSASFSSKPIAPQPLLGFSVTNSSPIVLHSRSSSRRASAFKSHLSARGSVPPVCSSCLLWLNTGDPLRCFRSSSGCVDIELFWSKRKNRIALWKWWLIRV